MKKGIFLVILLEFQVTVNSVTLCSVKKNGDTFDVGDTINGDTIDGEEYLKYAS